ncbi:MAG: M13 family metallopeptidase [Bacteroidia bacterium]|nr:M13 family metallopeptidase [Bacteroidia bacterium]
MIKQLLTVALLITTLNTQAQSTWGYDKANNADTKCEPCDNFYQFVNGGWKAKNPVPAEYSRYGVFTLIQNRNQDALKGILDNCLSTKQVAGSNAQKLADYYYTVMDTNKLNTDGYTPIKNDLAKIDAIKNLNDYNSYIANMHAKGQGWPFAFYVGADEKNSNMNIGYLAQNGLNLPEKEYYTKTDAKSLEIREAYKVFITKLFTLIGTNETIAVQNATTIVAFETKLAEVSKGAVEMRDPKSMYNVYTLATLQKLTPHFNWTTYFKTLKVVLGKKIIVGAPNYLKGYDAVSAATPLADMKLLLKFNLLTAAANYLSKDFVQANFDFNEKILRGTKKMKPRWKIAVSATDVALGDALGQVYVTKYFPPAAKTKMTELVNNLKIALRENINQLSWMSDSTRINALKKLGTFTTKIGYPDKWKNYATMNVNRSSYWYNSNQAMLYETRRMLAKLGKPVDKTEWGMTTPTVNAYYNPAYNEIVFPAGILQPPFFDLNADDAVNYGGIGGVIGHEMTHGFDDQGAQYDEKGNLNNWFAAADMIKFKEKSKCVINQFNNIVAIDTLKLNGELVVGESIADLGGITIAYAAYKNSLIGKPTPPVLDGFTGDQRFFIGWAQGWCSNELEQSVRLQINTDPHPISRERVNAPLSNNKAFRAAFGCKDGQKMVAPVGKNCEIW